MKFLSLGLLSNTFRILFLFFMLGLTSLSEAEDENESSSPVDQAFALLENRSISVDERVAELRILANAHGEIADIWAAYGEALERAGNDEMALKAFERATQLDPDIYSPWLWIGIISKRGTPRPDLERAEVAFRRALKAGAPKGRALNELGVTLALRGNYKEAISAWESALETNPDWGVLYSNLVKAATEQGDLEKVDTYIDRALQSEPFQESAILIYGKYLFDQGDYRATSYLYRKAIKFQPGFEEFHFYLANSLAERGRTKGALLHYNKAEELALEKDPANSEILQAVEWEKFRLRYPDAEKEFQKARKKVFEPERTLEAMEANMEDAIEVLSPLLLEYPDFWNGYFVRGTAYRRLGNFEAAMEDFKRVLSLFPEEPNTTMQMAFLYADQYELEPAVELAKKAIELAPRDPTFAMNAAFILIEAGECDEAWSLYDKVLRMVGERNAAPLLDLLEIKCKGNSTQNE